jgi:formiminoglutamase
MTENFQFKRFKEEEIKALISTRDGETKLGERISTDPLAESCTFVIFGITENIGPQSNFGISGSENAFPAFLKRFLNMQSNRHLIGENIAVGGQINQNVKFSTVENGKKLIEELDELVYQTVLPIINAGKIPIVIGGGHNNAFPLIKACSKSKDESLSVINLDPHADCRPFEGRHSGNPFSYAFAEGFLSNYTVLGLHKSYNSEYLLQFLDEHNFHYTFYEDYLSGSQNLTSDIARICESYSKENHIGIELDMDAIQFMPSSAFTPSGITLEQARLYIMHTSQIPNVRYLHLPEAAPMNDNDQKVVGKALAYLVWDFIHHQINNS